MSNEFIAQRGHISKIKQTIISTVSGSTVFDVQGVSGQLFSITDTLIDNTVTITGNLVSRKGQFSDVITSTVTGTTAPFVVASTTKVTNLNADLLDGYTSDTAATINTIALRDSGGDLYARYFMGSYVNMTHAQAAATTDTVFYSSTDSYIRKNTAGGLKTSLGATTVGNNLFTLANPTAITFLRINADNSVSTLDAATFRTAIGVGTGTGTVTSVTGTTNQGVSFSVANSTTTPNITLSLGALTSVTSLNGLVITANTGVITTGTWNAGLISSTYGGTGINNAGRTLTVNTSNGILDFTTAVTLTIAAAASISGGNTGDVSLATNHGLSLSNQIIGMGTPSSITSGSTNSVTTTTHTHAISGYQTTLTNPITGTGTINYVAKFTGTSALGNSLIFDDGTNVGIGTTAPTAKLDVVGGLGTAIAIFDNVSPVGGAGGELLLQAQQNNASRISVSSIKAALVDGTTGAASGDMLFKTRNAGTLAERMRILANGNVGIGTTAPGAKLHLYGAGTQYLKIEGTGTAGTGIITSSGGQDWYFGTGAATAGTDFEFYDGTGTTGVKMVIQNNTGNVGIGTTAPTAKLTIGDNSALTLDNQADLTKPFIGFGSYWNGSTIVAQGSSYYGMSIDATRGFPIVNNNINFSIGGSGGSFLKLMTIRGDGNVGIGTTTFDVTNPEKLIVAAGVTTSVNSIVGTGSINSYLQLNIKNTSTGTAASSDVIATADNGSETTNFIDMGINGSTYTGSVFGVANDAYLYNLGQNLNIGTGTASKNIAFITGGVNIATNTRMTILGSNGNVGIGSAVPSEVLSVVGNIAFGSTEGKCKMSYNATEVSIDFIIN